MTITFNVPIDEDGFFNIYSGAGVFDGDSYLVKRKGKEPIKAVAYVDEYASFAASESEEYFDDVERVKPLRDHDRISLTISASQNDLGHLLNVLRSLGSVNRKGEADE